MGVEFCPVLVSHLELKCAQPNSVHVGAMFSDPQVRGIKRKCGGEDEEVGRQGDPRQQRQSVFNISMCKLHRFRQAPDPSLLRTVLICNTLRNLEHEMERDGIKVGAPIIPPIPVPNANLDPLPSLPPPPPPPLPVPPLVQPQSNHAHHPSGDSVALPPFVHHGPAYTNGFDVEPKYCSPAAATTNSVGADSSVYCANGGSAMPNCCADYDRYLVDLDVSSGRMTPFVRTVIDRVDTGALWNDDSDCRLTSLNWSSVLNFNTSGSSSPSGSASQLNPMSVDSQYDMGGPSSPSSVGSQDGDTMISSSETSLHTLLPPSSSSPTLSFSSSPSQSPSSLSSTTSPGTLSGSSGSSSDEIFGDIDLSLYDFDLLSPLSPPNVKLAPVSAEELMRSLSDSGENSFPCQSSNYYKNNEGFSEDRDHVTTVMS